MSVELGTNAIGRDGGWHWESDRAIRALKPGNAGRAKGPDFRRAVEEAAEGDIGESLFKPHADPKVFEAALSPGEASRGNDCVDPTTKPVGKPGAGNPHAGFDERGWETGPRAYAQSTRAHPRLYFGHPAHTGYKTCSPEQKKFLPDGSRGGGRSVPTACFSCPTRLSRCCSVDLSHTPPTVISQNHSFAPVRDRPTHSAAVRPRSSAAYCRTTADSDALRLAATNSTSPA